MTVKELCEALTLQCLAGQQGLDQTIRGGYCGDLLSWVMSRAGPGAIWITVMGNVNAVAVAKLADLSCILLCEGAALDGDAKAQADGNGIPVVAAQQPAYELATAVAELLETPQ